MHTLHYGDNHDAKQPTEEVQPNGGGVPEDESAIHDGETGPA